MPKGGEICQEDDAMDIIFLIGSIVSLKLKPPISFNTMLVIDGEKLLHERSAVFGFCTSRRDCTVCFRVFLHARVTVRSGFGCLSGHIVDTSADLDCYVYPIMVCMR